MKRFTHEAYDISPAGTGLIGLAIGGAPVIHPVRLVFGKISVLGEDVAIQEEIPS